MCVCMRVCACVCVRVCVFVRRLLKMILPVSDVHLQFVLSELAFPVFGKILGHWEVHIHF
jgi:hypothetical protein